MTKTDSMDLPYQEILLTYPDFIESYTENDAISLLEMAFKFDIYQAKDIIDDGVSPIKSANKFHNFCKEIISLNAIIKLNKNPDEFIIYRRHGRIYNLLINTESIEAESFKFRSFINFYCGYFANKISKDFFVEKFLDENFLKKDELIINKKKLAAAVFFFDCFKEYFTKDEVNNFISKYQNFNKFIKFFDLEDPLLSRINQDLDAIIFAQEDDVKKPNDFSAILEKNQLQVSFEKAIYFTLYHDNFEDYLENLEQRFEANLQDQQIFLMEDDECLQFKNHLKNLRDFMSDEIKKDQRLKFLFSTGIKKELPNPIEHAIITRLSGSAVKTKFVK